MNMIAIGRRHYENASVTIGAVAILSMTLITCGCHKNPAVQTAPVAHGRAIPSYSYPVWSPDGQRLAFYHTPLDSIYFDASGQYHAVREESLSGVWMMNAEGTDLRRVLALGPEYMDWSGDGAWIAFEWRGDIYKVRTTSTGLDSASVVRLTFEGRFFGPSWNPSGTQLVFYLPSDQYVAGLYRLGSGGGTAEPIGERFWRDPDWSHDGTKIVFVGPVGSAYGVARADSDGFSPVMLESTLQVPEWPKWSPDDSKIALVARAPGGSYPLLWVVNADGTGLRQVTPDHIGYGIAWSPGGNEVTYVRSNYQDYSYANGAVWAVNIATGSLRQLTYNGPQ